MRFGARIPPSVPTGHLPLKGGDRRLSSPLSAISQSSCANYFARKIGSLRAISPREGEMSATLTEGGKPLRKQQTHCTTTE